VRARLIASCPQVHEEDLAAATVVGEGIGSDPTTLARAFAAARTAGVELAGHDAAPLRLTFYVAPTKLADLVRCLHRTFLEA
jgi:aspartokinase